MIRQLIEEEFCLACRGCCRFGECDSVWAPSVSATEIAKLLARNVPPVAVSERKKLRSIPGSSGARYACVLLNQDNNRCTVYSARPFECQIYPFLVARKEEKVFLASDPQCPYVRTHAGSVSWQHYIAYLRGLFMSDEYRALLRENPHFIQAYPGATNIFEISL